MPWTARDAYLKANYSYDPLTGFVTYQGRITGSDCHGYLQVHNKHGTFRIHRLGWFLHYGSWPSDQLNHKNGDKKDNRIDNLEEATAQQNKQHSWIRNGDEDSCIRVRRTDRGKDHYFVQVKVNGKRVSRTFKTIEAARVYRDKLRGEWNAVDS